jgi:hypothetical protein
MQYQDLDAITTTYPAGFWKCEASPFPEFKPGQIYTCSQEGYSYNIKNDLMPVEHRSFRLRHGQSTKDHWSPYFVHDAKRFNYENLKMTYLRPFTQKEWDADLIARYPDMMEYYIQQNNITIAPDGSLIRPRSPSTVAKHVILGLAFLAGVVMLAVSMVNLS